jgi:parallel beta-helix repeat protein/predicted outer membrane repeat protein
VDFNYTGSVSAYGFKAYLYPIDSTSCCLISGNTASGKAGGIYIGANNYNTYIVQTVVSGNSAGTNGGGSYISRGNYRTYTYLSTFESNVALLNGGAVYISYFNYDVKINATYFAYNTAMGGFGGALYLNNLNGVYASSSDTTDDVTTSTSGVLSMQNSTLFSNVAATSGGALYMGTLNFLQLKSLVVFSNNSAGSLHGGAVYLQSTNILQSAQEAAVYLESNIAKINGK